MDQEDEMYSAYHKALFGLHDKHERVRGLYDIRETITQPVFWRLFREVWRNSESLFLNGREIREMLTIERICATERFTIMSSTELDFIKRAARRGVPLKVYRGGSRLNHTGFSWTTKYKVAEQFAALSGSNQPTITIGRVPVPNIILYLSGSESEIVALPEHVTIDRIEDFPPLPADQTAQRQVQIAVQAKGANALMQMTPAEYFQHSVANGSLDREVVINHMRASFITLELLGFTSRLGTVRSILQALGDESV